MDKVKKIFIESLIKDHPMVMMSVETPAIKTVQKFAGKKFPLWAYEIFRKR